MTEASLISKFIELGADVYPAFGENTRSDMIVDNGDELIRVQAKTGRYKDGKVVFNTEGWWSNTNSNNKTTYDKDCIDMFAVYCPDLNGGVGYYCVDVEEAPKGDMGIRIEPTENGQTKGIRWAKDYLMTERFI